MRSLPSKSTNFSKFYTMTIQKSKGVRARRKFAKRFHAREGAATVEFALVAPLLFLILFMTIEASRFLMGLHSVAGAAREANRVFAVRGDETEARTVALDYMQRSFFNIQDLDVTFTTTPSTISGFEVLSCEVEIDYEDVSLISDPFNLGAQQVRGHSSMYKSN